MLRIASGLLENGYRPYLACPVPSALAERAAEHMVAVFPLVAPAVFDAGATYELAPDDVHLAVEIGRSRFSRRLRTVANYARVLPAACAVAKLVRNHRIDIVHSNSPRAATVGGVAARLTRRTSVTHVRDIVHTPFAHAAGRALLRSVTDTFLAASVATQAVIKVDARTHVIYDGIAPQMLECSPPAIRDDVREPIIGMLANLSPWKGHADFIRAARFLLNRWPSARFVCFGAHHGPAPLIAYKRRLDQMIVELGLGDRVVLAGPSSDIVGELGRFDVFVHPPTAPDPFPGAVLEAAAMRRPIVATSTGGIPEIVTDEVSGRLVPPSQPELLADAIADLIVNRRKAALLGEEARRRAERFTMAATIVGVTKVYADLANRQVAPVAVRTHD